MSDFQFFAFPIGYRPIGVLTLRWGLKTHFNFFFFFLKGIFAQEGSSGTRFDHGQIENKTFSIYAPPNYLARPILISSVKFIFLGQPTTNLTAERFQEIVRQWIDSGGGGHPHLK